MAFAIVALIWPSPKVSSTEEFETEDLSVEGDSAAREAFRLQLLQDENGQLPANAWRTAYDETQAMPFLLKHGTIFYLSMGKRQWIRMT